MKIHVNNIKKGTSVLQQQKIRVIINGVIMISFFGSTGLYTTETGLSTSLLVRHTWQLVV